MQTLARRSDTFVVTRGAIGQTSQWLRLIPSRTPGKGRLARTLLKHRLPEGENRVTDRLGLSYRVPNLHEPAAFSLLVDGIHQPDVLEVVLDLLPEGGTFGGRRPRDARAHRCPGRFRAGVLGASAADGCDRGL